MRRLLTFSVYLLLFCVQSCSVYAGEQIEPVVNPSVSITPTQTIVPTAIPTITPLSVITPTPTQLNVTIEEIASLGVVAGDEITIPISITGATPNSSYSVKILVNNIDTVVNKSKVSNGEWISWNASWSKFPVVQTDADGYGNISISNLINDETLSCVCAILVRLRDEASKNHDFPSGTIAVIAKETMETTNDETLDEIKEIGEMFISEIKEVPLGEQVLLSGKVTSNVHELAKDALFIEDETGGVKIIIKGAEKAYDKGTLIRVKGILSEAFNEFYVKVTEESEIEIIGTDTLPEPLIRDTGEINEEVEGKVIRIIGEVTATSGNTFYLNDGSGDAKIYIKDSTKIDKPKMRKGYFAAVSGVVSQYQDDYRVLPRMQSDIVVSVVPIDPKVLGMTVLPETGVSSKRRLGIGCMSILAGIFIRLMVKIKYRMIQYQRDRTAGLTVV